MTIVLGSKDTDTMNVRISGPMNESWITRNSFYLIDPSDVTADANGRTFSHSESTARAAITSRRTTHQRQSVYMLDLGHISFALLRAILKETEHTAGSLTTSATSSYRALQQLLLMCQDGTTALLEEEDEIERFFQTHVFNSESLMYRYVLDLHQVHRNWLTVVLERNMRDTVPSGQTRVFERYSRAVILYLRTQHEQRLLKEKMHSLMSALLASSHFTNDDPVYTGWTNIVPHYATVGAVYVPNLGAAIDV